MDSVGQAHPVDAVDPTYQLTAADLGKSINVLVEGSKEGYEHYPVTSAVKAQVSPATVQVAAFAPTTGRYTVPSTCRINGTTKAAGTSASGYTQVTITAVATLGTRCPEPRRGRWT